MGRASGDSEHLRTPSPDRYRVRYHDPSGASRSRTFRRKPDAERFAREVEPLHPPRAEVLRFGVVLGPSHYRTLRRVLQTAVEKDRLLSNPCDRVRPPKVPKAAMTVLTWEQAMALADGHSERYAR